MSLHSDLDTLPTSGRLLAVDLGEVRIGLAVSDVSQVVATPLDTIDGRGDHVAAVAAAADEHEVAGVVVGYPRTLRGREGRAARNARVMAEELGEQTGLPVVLWDERLTTVEAERVMLAQDASRATRRQAIDRVAASLLLQSVLDARRGGSAWR